MGGGLHICSGNWSLVSHSQYNIVTVAAFNTTCAQQSREKYRAMASLLSVVFAISALFSKGNSNLYRLLKERERAK